MITIFRNLRKKLASENRFMAYSRYAIGEIILVVIGILIALQVNNWNEKRKEQIQSEKYLKSMVLDLSSDTLKLNDYMDFLNYLAKNRSQLLQTKTVSNLSVDSIIALFQPRYDEIKINDQTFQKMRSMGIIEIKGHEKLMDSITYYYTSQVDRFNSVIEWEVEFSKKDADYWYYNEAFETPYLSDEFDYLNSEKQRKQIFDSLLKTINTRNRIRTSLFRKRFALKGVLRTKKQTIGLIGLINQSLEN